MQTKIFEVKDNQTRIPVIAIKLGGSDDSNSIAELAGYHDVVNTILVGNLSEGKLTSNSINHETNALIIAHEYIEMRFDVLPSGAVIDVQAIAEGHAMDYRESGRTAIDTIMERLCYNSNMDISVNRPSVEKVKRVIIESMCPTDFGLVTYKDCITDCHKCWTSPCLSIVTS